MNTERLYYNDPDLLEFDASIVETRELGDRIGVVLDRTAFYPTSGGQPNDIGIIDGIEVMDCYEDEQSGDIVHVLTAKPESSKVHGQIDAARRADHRQQHSGQHVLSQAFVELFNWPTVSFHLGAVTCTIDLPAESVTREQAGQAEALANRIVQENRSVAIRYVTQENIAEAGLRKATERTGEIRLIDISGFDRSACGGTHVRATNEIGPILITGMSRAKKETRVEFICGNRVLQYAREANRVLESISQTISAAPFDTASAVTTVWRDLQQSRKQVQDLESRLLDYEAAEFPIKDGLAVGAFKDRGIENLKSLAIKISARPGTIVLLADESDQLRVVFARSADMTHDVSAILKKNDRTIRRAWRRPAEPRPGRGAYGQPGSCFEFRRVLPFTESVLTLPSLNFLLLPTRLQ